MKKRSIAIYAMLWITILALIIAGLSACTKRMYIPVTTTKTIIDTIVKIQPDSSLFTALFECDSLNRVRLREIEQHKGATASQDVNFKDGQLRIETRWRTQYIDRIKEVHDTVTVVNERVEIKEVKHVPAFFWWCFGIALGSVLLGIFKLLRTFKIL